MSEFTDRLSEAAAAALADLGPLLDHELPKLKSVVLELELANGGQVVGATARVERTANIRRLTA